jgi:uncharacterized membrane protein
LVVSIVMISFGVLILYPVYRDIREDNEKKFIWIILDSITTPLDWMGYGSLIFGVLILVATIIEHLH